MNKEKIKIEKNHSSYEEVKSLYSLVPKRIIQGKEFAKIVFMDDTKALISDGHVLQKSSLPIPDGSYEIIKTGSDYIFNPVETPKIIESIKSLLKLFESQKNVKCIRPTNTQHYLTSFYAQLIRSLPADLSLDYEDVKHAYDYGLHSEVSFLTDESVVRFKKDFTIFYVKCSYI